MRRFVTRGAFLIGLVIAAWILIGLARPTPNGALVGTAEAVRGRPATPVSYAGVARRSTVGVGRRGVGAGARGPGVTHGRAGNRGGPVNRVGRR